MYCNSCVPSGEHLLSLFLCHVSCVRLSELLAGTLFLYFYPSRNVFIHRILIFCRAIVKIDSSHVFIFEAEDSKTKQSFLLFFLPLPLTSHSLSLCMFPPSLPCFLSHYLPFFISCPFSLSLSSCPSPLPVCDRLALISPLPLPYMETLTHETHYIKHDIQHSTLCVCARACVSV